MNIEHQLREIFSRYVDVMISTIEIKEENHASLDDYRKYAFVKTISGVEFILKAYKNNYNSQQQVDGYAELSEVFRQNGINVPRFYKNKDNNYLTKHDFGDGEYLIWCEEKLPYEVFNNRTEFGTGFFKKIGSIVGRMHSVSKERKVSYPWNSSLVLFNTFTDLDEYDENYENAKSFYDALSDTCADQILLNHIWDTYNEKRDKIKMMYPLLPYGAVQGDLSFCNIMKDDCFDPIAIIDFNQSGNARYVNDMMQWAIYFAFGSRFGEKETSNWINFNDFLKEYSKHYILNDNERSCLNDLYNLVRPFRYYENESVVLEMLEKGKIEEANSYMELILLELTREDICVM